jgi:hypothetical protein
MNTERLTGYELWDVTLPPLPSRSRLYHLAPIGLGTPYVESLTGYVARLAEAHNVRTRTLVVHELLPHLNRQHLSKPGNNSLASFWVKDSRALNSIRTLARDWVRVLEKLTGRRDLRFLTLLTWAEVLTPKGLLRSTQAWCPACYEEWAEAGRTVYEPLLWKMMVVTICPRHHRHLSTVCPYPDCGKTLPFLGPGSRPGHCPHCGRWLGSPEGGASPEDEPPTEDELQWQRWITDSIGELLVAAPGLSSPPQRERIVRTLSAYVEQLTEGNRSALSRELGLHKGRIAGWLKRGTVPQFELFLHMCYHLGTSPLKFLTEEPVVADRAKMNLARKKESPCYAQAPARPFDVEQMRCALETVLASDEHPPPAMRQIAKRLGRDHTALIHHFPELCHAISARYKAHRAECSQRTSQELSDEVHQAVMILHTQGVYPSGGRVAALLKSPGAIRHHAAQTTWRETIRKLGWVS